MLVDLRVKFKKSNIFEKTNNFNKRPQRKKKSMVTKRNKDQMSN
jgi:hypothetical protein